MRLRGMMIMLEILIVVSVIAWLFIIGSKCQQKTIDMTKEDSQ